MATEIAEFETRWLDIGIKLNSKWTVQHETRIFFEWLHHCFCIEELTILYIDAVLALCLLERKYFLLAILILSRQQIRVACLH